MSKSRSRDAVALQVLSEIGDVLARHGLLAGFVREAMQQPSPSRKALGTVDTSAFADEALPPSVRWAIKPGKPLAKFHLLAADATGTMGRVRKEAIRNLEHKPGADPRRTVRGLLARTKGPSRGPFIAELLADTPREYHKEVLACAAGFYRELGEKVSPGKLRKEAAAARK